MIKNRDRKRNIYKYLPIPTLHALLILKGRVIASGNHFQTTRYLYYNPIFIIIGLFISCFQVQESYPPFAGLSSSYWREPHTAWGGPESQPHVYISVFFPRSMSDCKVSKSSDYMVSKSSSNYPKVSDSQSPLLPSSRYGSSGGESSGESHRGLLPDYPSRSVPYYRWVYNTWKLTSL